jgi:hypothetical protein
MAKDSSKVGVLRQAYANAVLKLESSNQGSKPIAVNQVISGKQTIRMTQSYLRMEQLLDPNLTNYSFTVVSGTTNPPYPTENWLKLQDVFFVARMFFGLVLERSAGGNTQFANQLMTFPNPQFYGAAGLDLNRLCGIWQNGELRLTINNEVITPAWPLSKHFNVPMRQINTITWPNTDGFFNEVDLGDDGWCSIEPNWVLNGGSNIDLQIGYPTSLQDYGIGSSRFKLVLMLDGFLAQNASSIMN